MENKPKDNMRAGERARDEKREGGARYGGTVWGVADERGDRRFGHARNDDAAITEIEESMKAAREQDQEEAAEAEDLEYPAEDVEEVEGVVESGGQRVGIGRPEKPRRTTRD